MSSKFSYKWNHDFPKIIRDSGYTFNLHQNRICINWNDIKAIDIDKIIQERDFLSVDKYISEILNCQLEREFDTRILDSGFVKLFRLSQLSVEYLLECRKNLDGMVMMLKSELNQKIKETEMSEDKLNECLYKLKMNSRRSKKNMKQRNKKETENIFKGMFVKNDNYLITNGQYNMQFHKCSCCEKVFMNQFYLESHISRRHPGITMNNENQDSSLEYTKSNDEIQKLSRQVQELKETLHLTQLNINKMENNSDKSTALHMEDNKINIEPSEDQTKYEVDQKECEMISKDVFEKWKETEKANMLSEIDELKEKIFTANKLEFESIQKEILDNNEKERSNLLLMIKNQEAEIRNINNSMKEKTRKEIDTVNDQEEIWKKILQDSEKQHSAVVSELENRITELIKTSKLNEENYLTKMKEIEGNKKQHITSFIPVSTSREKSSSFHETEHDESMDYRKKKFLVNSQETLPPYKENDLQSTNEISFERPKKRMNRDNYKKYQHIYSDSEEAESEIRHKPKSKKISSKILRNKFENIMKQKNKTAEDIKAAKLKNKLNNENKVLDNLQIQKSHDSIQQFDNLKTNLITLIDKKMSQFGISKDSLGISNNNYKKKMVILKRKQHLLNEKFTNYLEIKNDIMTRIAQDLKKTKSPIGKINTNDESRKNTPYRIESKLLNSNKTRSDSKELDTLSITDEGELDLTDGYMKSESTDELLNLAVRKPSENIPEFSPSNMVTSTPIKEILMNDKNNTTDEMEDHKISSYSMYAGVSSSSSDSDIEKENAVRKALSEGNLNVKDESFTKKSVLKNAASTGSLAKKKVLFDLDANETKSVRPLKSETIAVKTKNTWNNVSINTDSDSDWNFPIDNESTKATVHVIPSESLQTRSKASTKIMELTKSIEAQLGARNQKPPIGGINIMKASTNNISDGHLVPIGQSSSAPTPKPRSFKLNKEKDVSDLEISDWSIDDLIRSN